MKAIVSIIKLFKRLGYILRGIGLIFCYAILFQLAIPDLLFNMTAKNVKTYTEEEILATGIKDLPRFLRISDVYPMGDTYIRVLKQTKKGKESLSSIIFPVYSYSELEKMDGDDLSAIPCNIVVQNSKVKESDIDSYFKNMDIIEGKFDHSFIKADEKRLLEESGYKLSDNCILIQDGDTPASTTFCIIAIILTSLLGIFLLLSLLPLSVFGKDEQNTPKIENE